ncbi:hypothetical protein HY494_02345 [Candidatus Woesearchaeota archaeon]|nr:hypothetical protein [Candidatus Woesearchaeota archaeon]
MRSPKIRQYPNGLIYTDSEGDEVIIGVIPPEDHSDNADGAVSTLIGDYIADSSRNPSSWKGYKAREFPMIKVTEEDISQKELDEIHSIERGAAYTADSSLHSLLLDYYSPAR